MMRIPRAQLIQLMYLTIDVALTGLAIYTGSVVLGDRFAFDVGFRSLFFGQENPFRHLLLFWVLVTVFINHAFELYYTKREQLRIEEISQVARAVFVGALLMIVTMYVTKTENFPRTVMLVISCLIFAFLALWRFFKRQFVLYLVRHGYNNFNVLIIGCNPVGISLVDEIRKRPQLGLNIVGFLDSNRDKVTGKEYPSVIGSLSDLASLVRQEFITKIIICDQLEARVFTKVLQQCLSFHVAVRVVPHGFEIMPGDFDKYNIGIIPVLEYSNPEACGRHVGKRVFDVVMSFMALMALAPLFLIIAVAIRLESPGPVFYRSKRYGRHGRKFNMYKFRSMVADADERLSGLRDHNEVDGPIFKIRDDPRVTRVGRVLRKYSLDELPQLFNVLRGNMSLVGPRPLPLGQVEREDFRQMRRLEVRPGITGLWQIRGRSDLPFARLVRWDIWYINNWSFWLDLNILWQTLPVVVRGKGAY